MIGPINSSGTIQKVIRQDEISTNKPARPGPINPGTTQAAANMPSALARRASGYIRPITTYIVTKSIPIAKPWIDRPRVRTARFGAKPATIDPNARAATAKITTRANPILFAHNPANVMPSNDAIVKLVNATA